jgi:class 3 adenylate cyclase
MFLILYTHTHSLSQDLVRFAYNVQQHITFFKDVRGEAIEMRIGIHTGYVIAGVVGRKMPR